MGGGGGSSGSGVGAPYDLLGGQYASFTGGTPSGINWNGVLGDVGTGLQSAGKNMQSGMTSPSAGLGNVPAFAQMPIQSYNSNQPSYIPSGNMQDIIMRILGGVI